MEINRIYNSDCLAGLKTLPDQFVNCCVTSPPYYGLRDYGHDGQIGLEEKPEQYVQKLVEVFREVRRVLRNDGVMFLNLGDSYYNTNPGSGGKCKLEGAGKAMREARYTTIKRKMPIELKPKDLIGIPWMVAFALRADGWYLRQDIIWSKPNPMPESVIDRCTKSHEYIFLLSKSARYYFDQDAIKQTVTDATIARLAQQIEQQKESERIPGKKNGNMKAVGPGRNPRIGIDRKGGNQGSKKGIPSMGINGNGFNGHSGYFDKEGNLMGDGKANKRSVWTVTVKPFSEAHFATYPQELIVDCIKAGCPEGGVVLDPFMGAGTTAIVARKLNRNYIGFELNPDYIKIAEKRIINEIGLFI